MNKFVENTIFSFKSNFQKGVDGFIFMRYNTTKANKNTF